MPQQIQFIVDQFRITRVLGISLIIAGLFTMTSVSASEKRVTVPIALPFQQLSSSVSSTTVQAASAPAYGLSTNQYTQSGTSLVTSSSSVASSAVVVMSASAASSVSSTIAAKKPISVSTTKSTRASSAYNQQKSVTASSIAAVVESNYPVTVSPPSDITVTQPIKAIPYPEGNREAFVAEFENYVAKNIAPHVPGVAIAIVSEGQLKSLQTFGVTKSGGHDKVTPDTVFRLASVSKTIAATASAIMVKDGVVNWDTKITSELPSVKFKNAKYGNQITLRHVLSQSSGLPTHTYSHFIDANMAYTETVRRLQYVNFVCPPGKCYAYQNVIYSLAGELIKKKAGMSYENYVEEKLFEPLHMHSASFGLENYQASPNRATPHTASGKRWIPTTVTNNWYHVPPAAGANASIADMSQFLLAQLGQHQDVLPLSTLNQIQARITKNTPAQNHYGTRKGVGNTAYGLGWRVFDYGRHKNFVHHGGWVKGFRSEIVFNRELQIGMVFLTNSETRLARDVIFKFMDMHERAYAAAKKSVKK